MSVCLNPSCRAPFIHTLIFIVNLDLVLHDWILWEASSMGCHWQNISNLSSDLKHNFSLPPPPSMAGAGDSYHQGNIRMTLEDPDLWRSFHEIGTEMIITKPGRYVLEPSSSTKTLKSLDQINSMQVWDLNSKLCLYHRRMFPHCKISLSGLVPYAKYILLVDMVPEDGLRYKVRTSISNKVHTDDLSMPILRSYPFEWACLDC